MSLKPLGIKLVWTISTPDTNSTGSGEIGRNSFVFNLFFWLSILLLLCSIFCFQIFFSCYQLYLFLRRYFEPWHSLQDLKLTYLAKHCKSLEQLTLLGNLWSPFFWIIYAPILGWEAGRSGSKWGEVERRGAKRDEEKRKGGEKEVKRGLTVNKKFSDFFVRSLHKINLPLCAGICPWFKKWFKKLIPKIHFWAGFIFFSFSFFVIQVIEVRTALFKLLKSSNCVLSAIFIPFH